MVNLEHPDITRARRTGYPEPEPKHFGHDVFGNEVLEGDLIVVDPDGEFVMYKDLEEYLKKIGFKFINAGEDDE